MNRYRFFLIALALACLPAAASLFSDAFPAFPPLDQGPQKMDFVGYRSQLMAAIQKKDAAALKPFLAANLEYSFGAEKPGVEGFYRVWKLPSTKSALWKELAQVVGNGGKFTDANQFVAPYWYSNWPKDRDNLEWEAVSAASIPVYFKPSRQSKRLPSIGHCLVHRNDLSKNQAHPGWTCIDLPESMQNPFKVESAFVETSNLRPMLGHRATFQRTNGRWQMVSFVAGD